MENPLRTWWKVRKWFRIPKPSIYFGPIILGLPCGLPDKWIELHSYDVTWKDKYDRPVHKWNPYFAITIFRKWIIYWTLCWSKDYIENMTTWEVILAHNYYNEDIKEYAHTVYWMGKDNIKHYINTLK